MLCYVMSITARFLISSFLIAAFCCTYSGQITQPDLWKPDVASRFWKATESGAEFAAEFRTVRLTELCFIVYSLPGLTWIYRHKINILLFICCKWDWCDVHISKKNRHGILVSFYIILIEMLGDFANICCMALDIMLSFCCCMLSKKFFMALCYAFILCLCTFVNGAI